MNYEKNMFITISDNLLFGEKYKKLSLFSKVLYCEFLRNATIENKEFFLEYPIKKIINNFNVSNVKAISAKKELEDFGLIFQKRLGLGLKNIIYLKME